MCGTEFKTIYKIQKNCSHKCYKERQQKAYQSHKTSPIIRNCVICRIKFVKKGRDKTCSSKCSKKNEKRNYLKNHKKFPTTKNCVMCHIEFDVHNWHQKYCSLKCSEKWGLQRRQSPELKAKAKELYQKRKKPPILKNCVMCGDEFVMNRATKMNCSPKCSKKYRNEYLSSFEYKEKQRLRRQNLKRKSWLLAYDEMPENKVMRNKLQKINYPKNNEFVVIP